MDINEIFALMDRAEQTSFDEISLEMDGIKMSLKKNTVNTGVTAAAPAMVNVTPVQRVEKESSKAEKSTASSNDSLIAVKAPLVGTFYRAASPEDKPFVMIGQKVKKGDVVGIIEAMKLMNEITVPEDGIVEAIEVIDGEMVEYNENLVLIKKAG